MPFPYGGPEMRQSFGQIALIEVIGSDPVLNQFVQKRFHNPRAIIYIGQEHRLISQRESPVCKFGKGFLGR
jgi:hypothetical protein